MEQSYYSTPSTTVIEQPKDQLETAAAEFSRNVQEATGKLVAATEQFSSFSSGLTNAVDEARSAAGRAEEAQRAAEAVQAKMAQDYIQLSDLIRELQERIAALAVLARPMPSAAVESEMPSEASPEGSDPQAESTPADSSDASSSETPSWQGWRGSD
jgi:hypothetical protein